eukprot:gene17939-23563_t
MSKILVLHSSVSSDNTQEKGQRRLDDLLASYKFDSYKIDGSDPETKELRDTLFLISGIRGKYPQVFIDTDGKYEYIGSWEQIETMNECESIPSEILEANPSIQTISKAFKSVRRLN